MLLENVHEERKNVGFRKGGKSAVGAKTFGGKWQGSDFEGNKK